MPTASEKRRAITAIFIVFLFIFSEVLVAENDYQTELEDLSSSYSIYSYSANHEVHISSQDPDVNFIGSSESSIGIDSSSNEFRSLYRFSNNLSKSTDLILSAQLKLTCNVIYQDSISQIPVLYPATVIANFAPSEVTWNSIADSIPWQMSGVGGEFDRKEWDVPSDSTSISANTIQYNLNVTKLVQNSLDLGRNNFDMIVSSLGGYVNCAKSNNATTTYHPELIISHSQGTHDDGGSVEQDFATNEAPLMKDDFIMSADIYPTISYSNLVGSDVEFQFSLSEDFRNISDLSWLYSTITNPFSRIGQTGSYDIPSSEAFPHGSKIFYRFRSIDNTSFVSDWATSFILLPDYTTVNNNDGTATITLSNNNFNVADIDLIDDTFLDSAVIQSNGDEQYLYVSNDVNQNKITLLKVNLDLLGLHHNSSILSASIELDRQTVTATGPELSLHPIDHSSWEENEATWNYGKVGQVWTSGGLDSLGASESSEINSNSVSNSFSIDIQNSVQQHLDDESIEPLSFALTGFIPGDSNPSQTEEIKFYSSEYQGISGFGPQINITYAWTNNQSTPSVELNYPIDESPAWEIIDDNITGDTTPTLEWQSSDGNFRNYLLQVSTDNLFRNLIIDYDSRIQGSQSLNVTQNYTFSSLNQLTKGELYHWRIKQIDGDDRVGAWNSTSFFISLLESEWLGGDMFRFVINNSLDTTINAIPGFKFSSISSNNPSTNSYGYPHLFVADSMSLGKYNALLGLQLNSYSLPPGYAVISSNLSMTTQSSSGGSIDVGVWELSSNDWNEQEVTWLESSSGNPWDSPGASGALDRLNLLSSSGVAANCCTTWNVTSTIQNSMRDGYNPSFMFEMMTNSYGSNALFYSPQASNSNFQPQLEIIFTLGSNQKPIPPYANSPTSGDWVFKNNSTLESETNLELFWSHNNPMPIIGWALEIDSTNTFDSIDKRSATSWNDPGFDVVGGSYTLQSPLDIGKKWYWKVRGLSNTYQLGDWSQDFTFYLPDLNYNQVEPGLFTTEYSQGSAFTNTESLDFSELFVTDSIIPQIDNGVSDTILTIGKLGSGDNSSMLISIPMPLDIHPENASLTSATFSLEATALSSPNVRMAIREILQPWDINANNSMYDSTNNWSQFGGRGIGTDISEPIDIVNSQIGKNQWNITEYVQKALSQGKTSLSLMIYTDADQIGQLVYFHSSESLLSKPTLNMTWAEGQRSIPADLPNTIAPINGQIYYNQSSHAVLPELRPTYSWSMPQLSTSNPDAWRIYFQIDPNNDMEGELMFDSRTNPELFDLNTLEFIPNQDINFGSDINWFVQPIELGMFGYRSNMSTYYIPNSVGQELNQTDATIVIQDGNIFQSTNFPLATSDTYLDEGNPSQSNNLNGLMIGNSTLANSNLSSTTSLISFNWSMIDLPSVFEVISAELELTAINGSGVVDVSASRMLTNWDEYSTWNNSSSTSQWLENGALRGGDSDLPDSIVLVDSVGTYSWNVTRILQIAIDSNHDSASILLQPEIINSLDGTVEGNYLFADSENQNILLRPKLSIHYRTSQSWLPSAVTLISPSNGSTLWNETSPALIGVDNISFEITQPVSNHTTINLCHGKKLRWLDCVEIGDNIENYSWDSISNIINFTDYENIEQEQGDEWQFWRVRVDQEHRIGYYSNINMFRVPEEQTTYDGIENYQVELYRGSVFQTTGNVPEVIDASTDSINSQNLGQSSVLSIGTDVNSGSVFESYLEYNFSDLNFVPTATPISMILELEVFSIQITQFPMSIALYACDSFDESTISSSSTPSCSNTEVTRTSLTGNSGNIITWDLTSLGQTNFFTSNDSLAFKLSAITGQNNFIEFHSSESVSGMMPKINLTYIENLDQYMPPAQPVPVAPLDGQILYDTTSLPVDTIQSVQLEWSQVTTATSYKLFIKNNGLVSIYDSVNDLRFSGNTFTGTFFNPGQSYEWWVQGFNQSIPGPPSQKWIFGVGEPNHDYNKDGTFVYTLSDSSEIPDFNHINVQDNWITSANLDVNYGFSDSLVIGGGCENVLNSICDAVISIDTSQIPVDSNSQSLHSITLDLFVESWDLTGGAYEVDFSVHEFLYANWDEMSLTWNNTGITPGPQPGVDFVTMPIDVKTYTSSDSVLSFDVAQEGQVLGDVLTLLIRGTPISGGGNFDGFVSVYSSDYQNVNLKPKWSVYHTNVSNLNITSPNSTYNADDSYTFDVQSFDFNGLPISGGVPLNAIIEWSTTSGTIINTGPTTVSLSPTTSGLQVISACYGIICTDYTINIDSGEPVQIFASLSSTSDVNFATISADETITVSAYAVDQYGNLVTNEVISFTSSNGTVSTNGLFSPYSTGIQTITAEWIGASNTLQEDIQVEVTPGLPVRVDISGCNEVIHADTSCDIFGTAFDQFDNLVWFDDVGDYNLNTINGEILQVNTPTPHTSPPLSQILIGEYTGDLVGEWEVSFTSSLGITNSLTVNVTHGVIQSFELDSSSETITADEVLYLNTTRIDVRGNRLPVTLPIDNWTSVADGQLVPGLTASWYPLFQGTKSISATYQGYTDTVQVFVTRGLINELNVIIDEQVSNGQVFSITADDEITASIIALDANGNQWLVDGNWSYFHPDFGDESILSSNYSQEMTFSPVMSSVTPYTINVEHTELAVVIQESFVVYVSVGDVENFDVESTDSNGINYNNVELFDITSDEFVQFSFTMTDFDLNSIAISPLWVLENVDTGEITDITQDMEQNALIWHATEVGNWEITTYTINNRGFNLTAKFDIIVSHGAPVSLGLLQSVTTQDAGNFVDLQVTGTDSDGNQFPQAVVWLENNGPSYNINATDDEGIYRFNGRTAGNYTLTAEYLTLSSSVNVDVFSLGIVKNIVSNISTVELEQLEVITVQVDAYDQYWNKIPVPNSARIDTTDRGDVNYLGNGTWELETLDEGQHSATIVVGSITETFTYDVEGNFAGFFAAGGPLYYVGAGLIGLIVVALLIFVVRLVRGDEDYYDDEDEDDDYYQESASEPVTKDFSQPRISQAPTVTTPPPQPPTPEPETVVEEETTETEAEDTSWMADYRVEDDGTEWGQTEDGVWYYREVNADDWVEWTD